MIQLSSLYDTSQAMALILISVQIYRSKYPQEVSSTCIIYFQNTFWFSAHTSSSSDIQASVNGAYSFHITL